VFRRSRLLNSEVVSSKQGLTETPRDYLGDSAQAAGVLGAFVGSIEVTRTTERKAQRVSQIGNRHLVADRRIN
jgi:hypothetical protein